MPRVVQQPNEQGERHPIGSISWKLSTTGINYQVHDKQMLAIIETFRDCRPWRIGTNPPGHLKCFTSALAGGSQLLSRTHPDKDNLADAASRRPDYELNPTEDDGRRPDKSP
ncbi:hypothetical protein FRB90_007031 [Tulasnella sp. 427]|nr:hypothetical protein FRB90_007031 [Tulasnella sp. 427]